MILLAATLVRAQSADIAAPHRARIDLTRAYAGARPSHDDVRFEWGAGRVLVADGPATPVTMSGYSIAGRSVMLWSDPVAVPKSGGTLELSWMLGLHRGGDPSRGSSLATPEQRMLTRGATFMAIELVDATTGERFRPFSHRDLSTPLGEVDASASGSEHVDLAQVRGRKVVLRATVFVWGDAEYGSDRSATGAPIYTASEYAPVPTGTPASSDRAPDGSAILR
jgi:hypothetical protein